MGNKPAYKDKLLGLLTLAMVNYCLNHGETKVGSFNLKNHHECLSYLFPLHLNTCYESTAIRNILIFKCGGRRRQILTYQDGPSAEKV